MESRRKQDESGRFPEPQESKQVQNPFQEQDWNLETYKKFVEHRLRSGTRSTSAPQILKKPSQLPKKSHRRNAAEPVTTSSEASQLPQQVPSPSSGEHVSSSSALPDSTSSIWSYQLLPSPEDSPRTIRAKLKRSDGTQDFNRRNTV